MKQYFILIILIALGACTTEKFDNRMQEDVLFLADDKLEGRQTGSEGEQLAADYIIERFKKIGLDPKGTEGYFQAFTFKPKKDPHSQASFSEKKSDSTITGKNVIGYIDNGAENTIIIGAHYDHLGFGEDGGSLHAGEKAIHNGADDNASGVSVMMNLAAKLKKSEIKGNNYLFMAFSGEEMGLLGSNYFVKNGTIDISKTNYMINMDMVGRMKQDSTLAIYGTGTSPLWGQIIHSLNSNFKIVEEKSGVGPSDHTSFYLNDIPVLHFFTGQHENYHKPSDDAELLNYEGMYAISDYIFSIIEELDDNGKLKFAKTKDAKKDSPRFKVTLGVMPDYLYDGKGMRIDGVTEDRPAHKAGILKGDVVVKMGDIEIADMMGYMTGLSKFKKGDSTTVIMLRDGKEITTEVTF
ncbi:M28 family peptidase [Urechidicola vernalis]|uniref:M28 family peptidase n=1 Tax=Urechidicola vernalis TaxID=3075600 RepID=A0ABU2Y6R7_9FLAO|nr:M28 family peptidase [Urechidicola sp. P050]MDT0553470.1 M28 family peptidase [Urechidicola sp. P050]